SGQHASVLPPPPPRPSGQHAVVTPLAPPPAHAAAAPAGAGAAPDTDELGWDDEELATNIYDGPQDAADAVVEDKPDLSAGALSAAGGPAPPPSMSAAHAVVTAPLPPQPTLAEKPRNGHARRRNPFDFVVPDSAPPATETPLITALSPGIRPRKKRGTGTYV